MVFGCLFLFVLLIPLLCDLCFVLVDFLDVLIYDC